MSSYLYSQENRHLYQETLDAFNSKSCVFSRNLLAMLESSSKTQGPFYREHIRKCQVCQNVVKDYSKKEKAIKSAIPMIKTPDYLADSIRPEIREQLSFLKREKKENSTWTLEVLQAGLKDLFITAPSSHTFISGVFFAASFWLFLKFTL